MTFNNRGKIAELQQDRKAKDYNVFGRKKKYQNMLIPDHLWEARKREVIDIPQESCFRNCVDDIL